MAMPKNIQTRFVEIRNNHNHYTCTSLCLLFSIITDLLMLTCSRHAILGSVRILDLHMEEIHVLPVSQLLIFMIPMLLKKQA